MAEEITRVVYWCPVCPCIQSNIKNYLSHVRRVHKFGDMDGKLYPIHVKDAVAKTKLVYDTGLEVSRYRCVACSHVFKSRTSTSHHLRLSPDGCLTCVSVCPEGVKLNETVGQSLLCVQEEAHLCTICGKSYTQRGSLSYHYQTVHAGDERKYTCDVCSATFKIVKNLEIHRRTHQAVRRKYICEICGKDYVTSTGLYMHKEAKHLTPRKYPCPVCHKLIFPKCRLNHHMKIHDVNRPTFTCGQCGQNFSNEYNLSVHERIHTGVKPYKCTVCVAAFAQKSSLNVHMRKHGMEIQQPRPPMEMEDISPQQPTPPIQIKDVSPP
ncbi:zinc finger protein 239-like [Littorina saxatilis]|uniref:C2H2-type domain-containing protein n=1 Tax=Littorina saxatilis TaxID=31220 RepID=A0AAN9GHB3_9CAEN